MVKSVFMKGTMESETKHHEKKKQSLKGKKVLCLTSHDHTMQYWRGSIVSSLSHNPFAILLFENVLNSLEILIGLEDPMSWGIRRDTD